MSLSLYRQPIQIPLKECFKDWVGFFPVPVYFSSVFQNLLLPIRVLCLRALQLLEPFVDVFAVLLSFPSFFSLQHVCTYMPISWHGLHVEHKCLLDSGASESG